MQVSLCFVVQVKIVVLLTPKHRESTLASPCFNNHFQFFQIFTTPRKGKEKVKKDEKKPSGRLCPNDSLLHTSVEESHPSPKLLWQNIIHNIIPLFQL